jgi:hypothetical protein
MKSRKTHPILSILWMVLLSIVVTSCVEIPSGKPLPLDVEIDTGRELRELMQDTMDELKEAERIAGEEAGETIEEAFDQLEAYTREIDQIFGDRLDRTIASLDAAVQNRLLWIQGYTQQVRGYALEIIHATGEEARWTIKEATDGMRRTIADSELAAQRTTIVATQNMIYLVDTIADRSVAIGGGIAGLLLTFICAYGWGRLIYARNLPAGGAQRGLALGFMALSLIFSVTPFTALIPKVRASALAQTGKATAFDLTEGDLPAARPFVIRFVPDPLVVPVAASTPPSLAVEGIHLMAFGKPTVTFGTANLELLGYHDDKLEVDIGPVIDDPSLAKSVDVQFGSGPEAIKRAVLVCIATPEPTEIPLVKVPDVSDRTVDQAKAELAAVGLGVDQELTEPHTDIEEDLVTRSEPGANTRVEWGSEVTLYISTGKPLVLVPNVEKQSLDEASAKLTAEGLRVGQVIEETQREVERGQVIRSDPIVGTEIEWGSEVTLYVSRGSICEITRDTPKLPTVTYHPPLVEGDREFGGNGPEVTVRVRVYIDNNELKADIHMSAQEKLELFDVPVEGDTNAYGTRTVILWRPGPEWEGWEIRRLIGKSESSYTYTDDDNDPDRYDFYGLDELVQTFKIIGDTSGDDVGDEEGDTGVTVTFNPNWEIELIETVDCIAARVAVNFTEITIDEIPYEPPLLINLDFNVSERRKPRPLMIDTFEVRTTYPINERFETILTEDESLTISVNGTAVDCSFFSGVPICSAPAIRAGYFQKEFACADEWGKGNHSDRSDVIPYYYTIHYTIDVAWLP